MNKIIHILILNHSDIIIFMVTDIIILELNIYVIIHLFIIRNLVILISYYL
jgi:hypothetical protein